MLVMYFYVPSPSSDDCCASLASETSSFVTRMRGEAPRRSCVPNDHRVVVVYPPSTGWLGGGREREVTRGSEFARPTSFAIFAPMPSFDACGGWLVVNFLDDVSLDRLCGE